MNILDQIIAHKTVEVEGRKRCTNLPCTEPHIRRDVRAFDRILKRSTKIGVIAEFKRASPSKGPLRPSAIASEIGPVYAAHGASAISVLTDSRFFQGDDKDLVDIRQNVPVPVLRKEFIIDEYQVHETAVMGADALLLIASVLDDTRLESFQRTAALYGMHCLVEVHDERELHRALDAGSRIIGINNRNLTDFTVTLDTSLKLRPLIPEGIVTVSESGILTRKDVLLLQEAGFDSILVGESLMCATEIGKKLDTLLGDTFIRPKQGC